MKKGMIQVLCGEGSGKSACAIGLAVKAAGRNQNIVIIQFLKGRSEENEISRRLEPEIKVFSFEKLDRPYAELSKEEQSEEVGYGIYHFRRLNLNPSAVDGKTVQRILKALKRGEKIFVNLLKLIDALHIIMRKHCRALERSKDRQRFRDPLLRKNLFPSIHHIINFP